jgi:hypothetical protein
MTEEVNPTLDSVASSHFFCRLIYGPDWEAVKADKAVENIRGARKLEMLAYSTTSRLYVVLRQSKLSVEESQCYNGHYQVCSSFMH